MDIIELRDNEAGQPSVFTLYAYKYKRISFAKLKLQGDSSNKLCFRNICSRRGAACIAFRATDAGT